MDKAKQHPPAMNVGLCKGASVDVRKASVSPSPAQMTMSHKGTSNKGK